MTHEAPSGNDIGAIREIARQALGDRTPLTVEPVGDGISTIVCRLRRGEEIFYLRVLPETDESLAPEAYAHTLLCRQGVHIPEVVYLEHCNEQLQRSVMVTTEIPGCHVGNLRLDEAAAILVEAGRELAIINAVPVEGFGWIKRHRAHVSHLEAEQESNRAFLLEYLDRHLSALAETALTVREVNTIRDVIEQYAEWLDVDQAFLAHGDFDVTHIYQQGGRYTGIIDFGEIRGTGPYYDLGHFRFHDGETAPYEALPFLVSGYQQLTPLPSDYKKLVAFLSVLIGIRFLARGVLKVSAHKLSSHAQTHARRSIKKDLEVLRQATASCRDAPGEADRGFGS